jgi:hypothetical protein
MSGSGLTKTMGDDNQTYPRGNNSDSDADDGVEEAKGCIQARCGLIAATTITTAVVIPVVIVSFGLPMSIIMTAPMPIRAPKLQMWNGNMSRYSRHRAKLKDVAAMRDSAGLMLCS